MSLALDASVFVGETIMRLFRGAAQVCALFYEFAIHA
jgi:hypothetical protein